jgi:uncharacterized membrane protein YhaH (DUF805 family)
MENFLNFINFGGRISRAEWWIRSLAGTVLVFIGSALVGSDGGGGVTFVAVICWILGAWISLSASVKRYHDRGKSGAWILIGFVPFIGWIWQLIELGCTPGFDAPNQFGYPGSGSINPPAQSTYNPAADMQVLTQEVRGYRQAVPAISPADSIDRSE